VEQAFLLAPADSLVYADARKVISQILAYREPSENAAAEMEPVPAAPEMTAKPAPNHLTLGIDLAAVVPCG